MSQAISNTSSRFGILAAVAVLVLAGAEVPEGQSPDYAQVWAIRIAQLVKESPGWETAHPEIGALAFSPDNSRLAVAYGTRLLILDVHSPEANVHQLACRYVEGISPGTKAVARFSLVARSSNSQTVRAAACMEPSGWTLNTWSVAPERSSTWPAGRSATGPWNPAGRLYRSLLREAGCF